MIMRWLAWKSLWISSHNASQSASISAAPRITLNNGPMRCSRGVVSCGH